MAGGQALARGLGVFSLGLGLYQVVAPRRFSQMIGVRAEADREAGVRALGARELGAAAGLLASPVPVAWMWMRVAGDVMDIALLRRALGRGDSHRDRVGTAIASVAAITAVDLVGSVLVTREARSTGKHGKNGRDADRGRTGSTTLIADGSPARRVSKSITVERPPDEVYAYWRDFSRLPSFMHHLEEVRVTDAEGRRSHWRARAPLGTTVEWDAELVEDRPNELISWRSAEGADVRNAGTVRFERSRDGGTIVRVELEYDAPAGPLGVAIAKLTGEEPETQTAADLRRFKQVLETGEVVRSEGAIGDRRLRQRPAQPLPA